VVADVAAGAGDRVAQPERGVLAHVVHVGQLGDAPHRVELGRLALADEGLLELGSGVEVVLERGLAATRDDDDVVDASRHGLFDHVLDRRLVDDRQHLLRLRLRGREHAGTEPGRRDHRPRDVAHRSALLS
jgi:hypothetical protein